MKTQSLYYAEMRIIINCDALKKERFEEEVKRKKEREKEKKLERKKDGDVKAFLSHVRPLASAYVY